MSASLPRLHLGLGVADLDRARTFYRAFLGVEPSKERPGFAKFEPAEPAVNLTLNEVGERKDHANPPDHFGIEVGSTSAVEAAVKRLAAAGLEPRQERETTCCYATQDKVWVTDPDGHHWEVFVVLDPDASERTEADRGCCVPTDGEATSSCC